MTISINNNVKKENQILFDEYIETGDLQIRNKIMELNLGLARREAYHWVNQCTASYDDLLQVGYLGLIRAIERFEPKKGYAFSSFAIPYIRGEIQHYLRDKGYSIRIPRRYVELKFQSNKIVRDLRAKLNRQPKDKEIASKLGISLGEWQDVKLAHQNRQPVSLDVNTNEEDNKSSLEDFVPDQKYQNFQLAQEDKIRLNMALSQLEEHTRQVLEFVFLQDLTQKETAEKLGISIVTVSRKVKQGITSMKSIVKKEDFE